MDVDKEFDEMFRRSKGKDKNGPKDTYIQRFSNDQYYAEAVLIAKKPKFLLFNNGQISIADSISNGDEIIRPLKALSYINKPYSFSSDQEVNDYVAKAEPNTRHTL